jgi:dTDP-4-dehydrorhamnose reductase
MPPLNILLFGTTGQLGREILRLSPQHDVNLRGYSSAEANFLNPDSLAQIIAAAPHVDVVVNAAAYTAVDKAESEPVIAARVNGEAVGAIAGACAKRNARLIHVSTDYVYDGRKPTPYVEDDPAKPLGVYGRTKLLGEAAIRDSGAQHVILRTSWIYSPYGSNFVKTMLRVGRERPEVRVVNDQHGAPTSATELASAILAIANRMREPSAQELGTFHFAAAGETTWYGFAEAIFDMSRGWTEKQPKVVAIPTSEYPLPAVRPMNSRLNCGKLRRVFGISPLDWQDGLKAVLSRLHEESTS